jgi:hypothetical protein
MLVTIFRIIQRDTQEAAVFCLSNKSQYCELGSGSASCAGFVRQKRGKTMPSFIKQRRNIDGIFLSPFLSNEPGPSLKKALKLLSFLVHCLKIFLKVLYS